MVPLLPPSGKAVRFWRWNLQPTCPAIFLNPTRAAPAWSAAHTTG